MDRVLCSSIPRPSAYLGKRLQEAVPHHVEVVGPDAACRVALPELGERREDALEVGESFHELADRSHHEDGVDLRKTKKRVRTVTGGSACIIEPSKHA